MDAAQDQAKELKPKKDKDVDIAEENARSHEKIQEVDSIKKPTNKASDELNESSLKRREENKSFSSSCPKNGSSENGLTEDARLGKTSTERPIDVQMTEGSSNYDKDHLEDVSEVAIFVCKSRLRSPKISLSSNGYHSASSDTNFSDEIHSDESVGLQEVKKSSKPLLQGAQNQETSFERSVNSVQQIVQNKNDQNEHMMDIEESSTETPMSEAGSLKALAVTTDLKTGVANDADNYRAKRIFAEFEEDESASADTNQSSSPDGEGSSCLQKPRKKMKRTMYSKEDLAKLNAHFAQNPFLSPEKQEMLAKEMGYTETQIKTWFQNKRASVFGTRRPKRLAFVPKPSMPTHFPIPIENGPLNQWQNNEQLSQSNQIDTMDFKSSLTTSQFDQRLAVPANQPLSNPLQYPPSRLGLPSRGEFPHPNSFPSSAQYTQFSNPSPKPGETSPPGLTCPQSSIDQPLIQEKGLSENSTVHKPIALRPNPLRSPFKSSTTPPKSITASISPQQALSLAVFSNGSPNLASHENTSPKFDSAKSAFSHQSPNYPPATQQHSTVNVPYPSIRASVVYNEISNVGTYHPLPWPASTLITAYPSPPPVYSYHLALYLYRLQRREIQDQPHYRENIENPYYNHNGNLRGPTSYPTSYRFGSSAFNPVLSIGTSVASEDHSK